MKKMGLDDSDLDYQNVTENKVERFIQRKLKKLIKKEIEIRDWISKFFSDKWYNEELERIKNFESIGEDIEGFQNDVEIQKSFEVVSIDGEVTEYIKKSPDVDKDQIQKSIQKIIPKYAEKAKKLLSVATEDLNKFNLLGLKEKKEIFKIITDKFQSYWVYLAYLRSAYVEILNLIRRFDYSLTVKFVMTTIVMVVYDIDEQRWYCDRIFGYKKVLKLLDGWL